VFRRQLLTTVAIAATVATTAEAETLTATPWAADSGTPVTPIDSTGWSFFTAGEAATIEAIVDRLIPADDLSIGGKEAGCAVFIDRQLAGAYGKGSVLYLKGPFAPGTPQQGPQSGDTPAAHYKAGLADLAAYCAAQPGAKSFPELTPEAQDLLLTDIESGTAALAHVDGKTFFKLLLKNTREGFLADPVYGGNKDMAGWKMLGFPGARYDYRDYIARRGENLGLAPVAMLGPIGS